MSLLQNSNAISSGSYDINNSLRLRSSASANLQRTPASATNRRTWTWSAWVKRGTIGSITQGLFLGNYDGNDNSTYFGFSGDQFFFFNRLLTVANGNIYTTQVFRDVSAWYHIVVAMDTTQATAANRFKLYVNGTQVTSFAIETYPTQNTDMYINSNVQHNIGFRRDGSTNSYFDGYLAEVNFVDGQQLTPSSFGETDTTTGSWVAKKYTGTYGTNGFYLQMNANNNPMTAATVNTISTYQASFSGSSQNVTSPTTGSVYAFGTGDFTIETFVKWNTVGTALFAGNIDNSGYGDWAFFYNSSIGVLRFLYNNGTGPISSSSWTPTTNTWYHLALVRNSGTLTFYVNGVSYGSTALATSLTWSSSTFYMGTTNDLSLALNGYMSNLRVVKGTAVYTSAFTPPTSALTNISGTSILTFQNSTVIDNSSNNFTLTKNNVPIYVPDSSSNGNTWIGNNISLTAGTTYDLMTDVPTLTSATVANYAVLNAVNTASNTITDGNLKTSFSAVGGNRSTIGMSSGKWYWEVSPTTCPSFTEIGIVSASVAITGDISASNAISYMSHTGYWWRNNVGTAYGATYTTTDVIGIAVDIDNNTITFYKNGTSQGAITSVTLNTDTWFACMGNAAASATVGIYNFGQRPFSYTPPTGFVALNTYNLPDSTIVQGNKYMDATLYTGNGATNNIVNAGGFKPDLVWTKSRSYAENNWEYDSVRGVNVRLSTNQTIAEATGTNQLNSFNSNGFSLGADPAGQVNASGQTYVGWQWQAGQGTTSSNTSGSITSTVSVNTTSGFSIVTYTGNATNPSTVGHGLGVAPKMIITKQRNAGTYAWNSYHASLGNTQYVALSTIDAASSAVSLWNNTSPTSTVFTINHAAVNSATTYVAYCWAEIAGFSKFGSYTGNGSTDGPFVYLGFRPKYVVIKRTDGTGAWYVLDSVRNTYNVMNSYNEAQDPAAEGTFTFWDFLSNGFKLRQSASAINGSGQSFIYMAFAENPFKNANAR